MIRTAAGMLLSDDAGPARKGVLEERDSDWNQTTPCGAVAELAGAVITPAIRDTGGCESAGVLVAWGESAKRQPASYANRARVLSTGAVAKLAAFVVAPAVGNAVAREPARVHPARSEGDKTQAAGNGARCRALATLTCAIA